MSPENAGANAKRARKGGTVNLKRWMMATLSAFGLIVVSDVAIHHCWLGEFYRAHAQWWRPEQEMVSFRGFLFASELALAVLLAFIYAKGYETGKGTVTQGFRFGVLMGLLLMVPSTLMHYAVYPYPLTLLFNWLVGGLIQVTLAGMIIGSLYHAKKK
ncbi:MAG: hypothetical protein HYZ91_00535 [Candidatus Omnitrophica bacterium]|nr:hypothetical protein [Candidatus Omnitrophota bacterium]